jgi:hypothetical protein
MRVFADSGTELSEPPLELAVEALLVCELLLDALEPALEPLDDRELGVDGEAQGADLGRLRGRDVVVDLLDKADERVGPFPVEFVRLPAGEHGRMTSRREKWMRGVGKVAG